MSDPLQPCEKKIRRSYECLQYLAETQYPFVMSTKGKLLGDDEYIALLEQCNCVVQVSMVCSSYDKIELGCPSYEERLEIVRKVAPRVKRLVVRCQPYMHEVRKEVIENLPRLADAGAYGVIVEGMKFRKKKAGLINVANDWVYDYDIIKSDFLKIQEEGHKVGLKVYAGENRLRKFGDSLSCCGFSDLEGFNGNYYNLNHILNGDKTEPTEKMKEIGTADCFRTATAQDTVTGHKLRNQSFAYAMLDFYKTHKKQADDVFGVYK